jgi:hypothetical protein
MPVQQEESLTTRNCMIAFYAALTAFLLANFPVFE